MDPDAALERLRRLCQKVINDYEDMTSNGVDQEDANALAEVAQSIDKWIVKGGLLPRAWQKTA